MDKYNEWNSRHIGQLEQVEKRIRKAAERVNRYCCEECED